MRRFAAFALASPAPARRCNGRKPDVHGRAVRAPTSRNASRPPGARPAFAPGTTSRWSGRCSRRMRAGAATSSGRARPMVDPYGYQLMEENRLAQFCMESKGYKLVPTVDLSSDDPPFARVRVRGEAEVRFAPRSSPTRPAPRRSPRRAGRPSRPPPDCRLQPWFQLDANAKGWPDFSACTIFLRAALRAGVCSRRVSLL